MTLSSRAIQTVLVLAIFAACSSPAAGADKYWVAGSAWWYASSSWSTTSGGAGGAGQPQNGQSAFVTNNYLFNYTVNYYNTAYPTAVHPYVIVNRTGTGAPTLLCNYNHPLTADRLYVGESDWGIVRQNTGNWTVTYNLSIGRYSTAQGAYYLTGGTLNSGDNVIGDYVTVGDLGIGYFEHSGGTHNVVPQLTIGYGGTSYGTYVMNDDDGTPALNTGSVALGVSGAGVFEQYAGTHHATGDLSLALSDTSASGTYELHGGSLDVDGKATIGTKGTGVFKILGGAATVNGDLSLAVETGSSAAVNVYGGTLTVHGNITDGAGSSTLKIDGTFNLDFQGATIAADTLELGSGASDTGRHATYSGESIHCQTATIGNLGNGQLSLTSEGSLHVAGSAYLAYGGGSNRWGYLYLYSGSLSTGGDLYIGRQGQGTVYQSGGVVTVDGDLYMASESGSVATCNLRGGTLTAYGNAFVGGKSVVAGGQAEWDIEMAAVVDVRMYLHIWPDARVNLRGGTLKLPWASYLHMNGGEFNFDAGTLEITQSTDMDDNFLTAVLGPDRALRNGQHLLCSGASAQLQAELVLDGGTFSADMLVNPTSLRFERGRFNKLGGDLVIGSAGLFGDSLTVRDQQHYHAEADIVIADGQVRMDGGRLSATALAVQGRLSGDGQVDAPVSIDGTGEVTVEASDTLLFATAGASANHGRVFLAGGTFRTLGDFTNQATGEVIGRGALIADGGIDNHGRMTYSAGLTDVRGDLVNHAGSAIIVTGGGTATFYDDVEHNGDEIRTSTGCASVFIGDVTGTGDFTGAGTVYFEGDVYPGASPGAMNLAGDVVFGSRAGLAIEIGGTVVGSGYDQVNVAGAVGLDGAMAVSLWGEFDPAIADEFRVLTYGSRSGAFAEITGWRLAEKAMVPDYQADALRLFTTYYGDADLDADVDLADLSILAFHWGDSGAAWRDGDFDGSGDVALADLSILAFNWNMTTAPPAIPEPGTIALLAVGAAALLKRRRKP